MAPFNTLFWRRWHRWVGFPAALFLLFAASTGFLLAFTEFFGADEALREATRDRVSPVTLASPLASVIDPLAQAITSAKAALAITLCRVIEKASHPEQAAKHAGPMMSDTARPRNRRSRQEKARPGNAETGLIFVLQRLPLRARTLEGV